MSICTCGRALKGTFQCGLCEGLFCKSCVEFMGSEAFSFMGKVPKELSHNQYCLPCYSSKVRSEVLAYRQVMKKAKEIFFLDKPSRRPLKVLKKSETPLLVENCADREETILRLAFQAASLGFDSVIKANVDYKKVRNEGYQKMVWKGTGIAATLDMKMDLDT